MTEQQCSACLETKPLSAFYGRRQARVCKPCSVQKMQQWYRQNAEKVWERNIFNRFGMTRADYDLKLRAQGGVCAICNEPPGNKRFAIDHCHVTGRIRGLLCSPCNGAIGMLRENRTLLMSAQIYLEDWDDAFANYPETIAVVPRRKT